MKVDLNNPWMLRMARAIRPDDGCGFIRGVIWYYLWRGVAGVAAGIVGLGYIIGIVSYIWQAIITQQFIPPILHAQGPQLIQYFGDAWYWTAYSFAIVMSFVITAIVLCVCAIGLAIYGLLQGCGKLPWAIRHPIRTVTMKIEEPIGILMGKICPKLEYVIPNKFAGLLPGTRIYYNSACVGWRSGVIVGWENVTTAYADLVVAWDHHQEEGNPFQFTDTIWVHWDEPARFFGEYVQEIPTVEEESSPQ